jgi:hypothetical protein
MRVHANGYWQGLGGIEQWHRSSAKLSGWLATHLDRSKPTYDFGCGLGTYLLALKMVGFTRLRGFEGEVPATRHFQEIEQHDLTVPLRVEPPGNVICLEVAEHVPPEHAETLIETLSSACSGLLVLSWAVRGQGGTGHLNELDAHEVLPRFESRGFILDAQASKEAREVDHGDLWWFGKSLYCLRRE